MMGSKAEHGVSIEETRSRFEQMEERPFGQGTHFGPVVGRCDRDCPAGRGEPDCGGLHPDGSKLDNLMSRNDVRLRRGRQFSFGYVQISPERTPQARTRIKTSSGFGASVHSSGPVSSAASASGRTLAFDSLNPYCQPVP